jgi:transcriptional regulator with XRE-family HTH domain
MRLYRSCVKGTFALKVRPMNITQCRMARAALGWTLDDLASASGVGRRTVAKFEAGGSILPGKLEAMRAAFVQEGIAFENGGKRAGVSYLRRD